MTELAPQVQAAEKEANVLPGKENPLYFGDTIEDQRMSHFMVPYGEREVSVGGAFKGYYFNEEQQRVDIVSPLNSPDEVVEVIEGKAVRTLRGQYLPGEQVSVRRSNGSIDTDWTVFGNGDDKEGRDVTFVRKMGEDGAILTKQVETSALRELNASDVLLPETSLEREQRLEQERLALGAAALRSEVVPIVTEATSLPDTAESSAEAVETDDEHDARKEREARNALDKAYKQHRQISDPHSYEAQHLEARINSLKQELGSYAQRRFKQRGF